MSFTRLSRIPLALLAAALLAVLAGCGSDSSGESSSTTPVSIPSPTSPIPTATATVPSTATGGGKKGQATTTAAGGGGGGGSCSIPAAYQDFKYTGLGCTDALAVAQAWDANGKTCNTVDNPESPIGPQRTCTVNGYSCTAKRDVTSDARFVTCTQGGKSVRFTWLPA